MCFLGVQGGHVACACTVFLKRGEQNPPDVVPVLSAVAGLATIAALGFVRYAKHQKSIRTRP